MYAPRGAAVRKKQHDACPVFRQFLAHGGTLRIHFPGTGHIVLQPRLQSLPLGTHILRILIPFPRPAQGNGFWEGEGRGGRSALEGPRCSFLHWSLGRQAQRLLPNLAMVFPPFCVVSRLLSRSQQPRDKFVSPLFPQSHRRILLSARTIDDGWVQGF